MIIKITKQITEKVYNLYNDQISKMIKNISDPNLKYYADIIKLCNYTMSFLQAQEIHSELTRQTIIIGLCRDMVDLILKTKNKNLGSELFDIMSYIKEWEDD